MTHTDGLKNVDQLINRFGGMRPMARKLDIAVSTIQGWKKRDHIPADRLDDVVIAAKANQISLDGYDVTSNTANENKPELKTTSAVTPPVIEAPSKISPPRENYNLDAGKIKSDAVKRSVLTTVSILAILGGVGYVLFGQDAQDIVNIAKDQKQIEQRFETIDKQYSSFEHTVTQGLNSLSDQVTDIAAAVGVERNADGQIILNNNMSMSERVTGLESRLRSAGEEIDLGQLMNRFDTVTQSTQVSGDNVQALNDLRLVIDSLQSRMGEFETNLQNAKDNNEELAKSLENVTGRDMGAAAMLLAMTQMRSSLNREQPFAQDLVVLQELVGDEDPALTASIQRLAPYAENGVLTPEGLSSEFRGMAGDILSAALRGEEVSVQDKIMGRIGQILSVEKDGKPVMGIKEQEIVSKAQKALDKGDVAGALRELNKLEGDAAQTAAPFKAQAQGTLNAENVVSKMMQTLLQKLQNPSELKSMMQNLPAEIEKQVQGEIKGSTDSGLIILE
jgi:hypothetical protein